MEKCHFLVAPQEQVGKGIFAAPLRFAEEDVLILFFLRRCHALKIHHGE